MALDPTLLASIRGEIGTAVPPTDEELEASFDRLRSSSLVVLEILRARYADLLGQPVKVTVPGYYSEDNTQTLAALKARIAALSGGLEPVAADVGGNHRIVRSNRWNRR